MSNVVSLDFLNLNNKMLLGCFGGWGCYCFGFFFWGFHVGMKVHVHAHVASIDRMNQQRKHFTDNIYIHLIIVSTIRTQ